MNIRDTFNRIRIQTLLPPTIVFTIFVLTVTYVGLVLSMRFENLQKSLSESESATRSLLTISKLRGDLREKLLLYRHTHDTKYLGEINDLDLERSLQTARFEHAVTQIGAPETLIQGFLSGARITKGLEYSLLDSISSGNDADSSRLFEDYGLLFDINGARLKDLHALIQKRLSTSEVEIHDLLARLPYHLAVFLIFGFIAAWTMTRFYGRRVLMPLSLLHRGLGAVSRGQFGEALDIPHSATEIKEMLSDFNHMTAKLKMITDELTAAREEAMHAANAKSEFLSNMSHEIRTPLNVIIGLSDLINERDLDRESKTELNVLRKSGNLLLNIVNDILDYSKLESGHVSASHKVFNLHQTIHNVAALAEPLAKGKALAMATQIAVDVPRQIYGDPQLFEQALLNLANNAVKFTAKGGVTIQARILRGGEQPKLEVSVIDTGIGIEADKIDKLFMRFEQADKSITRTYGGTGLGLAITKQIANLLGGEVKVCSVITKGSTFTLILPLFPAEVELEEVKIETTTLEDVPQFFLDSPKILLADDSEDNRFVIQHYLQPTGAQIIEVDSGQAAIDAFMRHDFDLVLMDIQMPNIDGYQATREIRRIEREMNRPHTPVIALTAFALKDEVERSFQQGCDAHATKPIRKNELLRLLQRFIPPTQAV